MKVTKESKGITLISLVITIVILVILAVIAVMEIKEHNIFKKAENSAFKYNYEKEQEESTIKDYVNTMNGIHNNNGEGTKEDCKHTDWKIIDYEPVNTLFLAECKECGEYHKLKTDSVISRNADKHILKLVCTSHSDCAKYYENYEQGHVRVFNDFCDLCEFGSGNS